MRSPILYFLLLVLGISLNLYLDVGHKQSRFSKTLSEKNFKFILSRGNNTIEFNLSLVLLPVEANAVAEERNCKGDALVTHSTGCVKIILALLTEVITFYV